MIEYDGQKAYLLKVQSQPFIICYFYSFFCVCTKCFDKVLTNKTGLSMLTKVSMSQTFVTKSIGFHYPSTLPTLVKCLTFAMLRRVLNITV